MQRSVIAVLVALVLSACDKTPPEKNYRFIYSGSDHKYYVVHIGQGPTAFWVYDDTTAAPDHTPLEGSWKKIPEPPHGVVLTPTETLVMEEFDQPTEVVIRAAEYGDGDLAKAESITVPN